MLPSMAFVKSHVSCTDCATWCVMPTAWATSGWTGVVAVIEIKIAPATPAHPHSTSLDRKLQAARNPLTSPPSRPASYFPHRRGTPLGLPPCAATQASYSLRGMNFSDAELMQYRSPSAPARRQTHAPGALRPRCNALPCAPSRSLCPSFHPRTPPQSVRETRQPVPLSNLSRLSNNGVSLHTENTPRPHGCRNTRSETAAPSPVAAPTLYCVGVSSFCHSASVCCTGVFAMSMIHSTAGRTRRPRRSRIPHIA